MATRYKQIPPGVSSPIDPDAPSLLTSVPPEVRNAIYEALFTRETVLLHNRKAYHAEEPDRVELVDLNSFNEAVNEFYRVYASEIGADIEFHNGLSSSLPLLHTCRQIYHEGVGILYGRNTFLVSRALHRHDIDWDEYHWVESYSQLNFAPKWLSGLRSQAALLSKVRIDVDAICPQYCEWATQRFDILPLLKFLWYDANAKCSVVFVNTERCLTMHEYVDIDEESSRDRADCFNNVLDALAVRDVLRIKLWAKSSRALLGVNVSPGEQLGSIFYCRSHDRINQSEEIEILNEGRTIRRKRETTSRSLVCLSRALLRRILQFAAVSSRPGDDIIFSLDERTVRGLPLSILQINRQLRDADTGPYSISIAKFVTIKLATDEIATNFSHIDTLTQMVSPGGGNRAYVATFE